MKNLISPGIQLLSLCESLADTVFNPQETLLNSRNVTDLIFFMLHLTRIFYWYTKILKMSNLCVTTGRIIYQWASWFPYPNFGRELNQPESCRRLNTTRGEKFSSIKYPGSFSGLSYICYPVKDTKTNSHYHYYYTQIWHTKNGRRDELFRCELLSKQLREKSENNPILPMINSVLLW